MSETTVPNGGSNKINVKKTNEIIDPQKYGMQIDFGDYEVEDPEKIKEAEASGTAGSNDTTGTSDATGTTSSAVKMGNTQVIDANTFIQAINQGTYVARKVEVSQKDKTAEKETEEAGQEK